MKFQDYKIDLQYNEARMFFPKPIRSIHFNRIWAYINDELTEDLSNPNSTILFEFTIYYWNCDSLEIIYNQEIKEYFCLENCYKPAKRILVEPKTILSKQVINFFDELIPHCRLV